MPNKTNLNAGKARVFIVDDHPIVRRGLQLLIALESDLSVCGEADSGPVAMQRILETKPDVAVIDLGLRESSGLELIKQLRAQCPRMKILVFSMRNESIFGNRALRAGADGYITKDEGSDKAVVAIRALIQGRNYVSTSVAEKVFGSLSGRNLASANATDALSDREIEVLDLLAAGLGSRQIAERLKLSIKTIETYREHLKLKLGLKSAAELVNYAFNWAHGREVAERGRMENNSAEDPAAQ